MCIRDRVVVTGSDRDAVDAVFEALTPGAGAGQSVCMVDGSAGSDKPISEIVDSDVIVLVSASAELDSEVFSSRLSQAEAAGAPVVVVLTEAPGIQVSFPGVGPRRVVGMAPGGITPVDVLAEAVADAAGDTGVALAAKLPVLRDEVCRQLIHRTARQNAVVGCLFII